MIGGGVLAGLLFKNFFKIGVGLTFFFRTMWFLRLMRTRVVYYPYLYSSKIILSNEFGWDEIVGGYGTSKLAGYRGGKVRLYQNVNVKVYLGGIFIWLLFLLIIV